MHLGLGADVDSARRLVNDEEPRVRREPLGEDDLLLVASGQRGYREVLRSGLHLESTRPLLCGRALTPPVDDAEASQLLAQRESRVAGDREVHDETLLSAVLRNESHPGVDGGLGRVCLERFARDGDRSGVVAIDSEDRASDLGTASTDEPGERDDLTGAHVEADVREDAAAAEVSHRDDGFADLRLLFGEQRRDVAPDHFAHQAVDRDVLREVGGDEGAVAHDGDAVAEIEDLVEAVRDEQDAGAPVAQRPRNREQAVDLDAAECGRRFVHDEDFGIERDGLGDLDDLLVGDGKTVRDAVRMDRHAEAAEQLARPGAHRGPVDEPEAATRLPADEDVLGDREVREERRLLVDDRDAGGLTVGRAPEGDLVPVDDEASRVGVVHAGEDLDER